jgi:hypothetical protein
MVRAVLASPSNLCLGKPRRRQLYSGPPGLEHYEMPNGGKTAGVEDGRRSDMHMCALSGEYWYADVSVSPDTGH